MRLWTALSDYNASPTSDGSNKTYLGAARQTENYVPLETRKYP
jgi:hypothetical protein